MQEILAGWFYPCNNKLPSPRDVFMSLKEQKKSLSLREADLFPGVSVYVLAELLLSGVYVGEVDY